MDVAKLFANGRSQAVRLPRAYRFSADEVAITRVGDAVVLLPKESSWGPLLAATGEFTDDFMAERDAPAETDQRTEL